MNDVEAVRVRLRDCGIAVDDAQAQEVLEYSLGPTVGAAYRDLPIGDLEPMAAFDPRWRA
jgi:hypothetical protein